MSGIIGGLLRSGRGMSESPVDPYRTKVNNNADTKPWDLGSIRARTQKLSSTCSCTADVEEPGVAVNL